MCVNVGMWFERTVAVAQREQSGGEPFPPAGLDRAGERRDEVVARCGWNARDCAASIGDGRRERDRRRLRRRSQLVRHGGD